MRVVLMLVSLIVFPLDAFADGLTKSLKEISQEVQQKGPDGVFRINNSGLETPEVDTKLASDSTLPPPVWLMAEPLKDSMTSNEQ